MRKRHSTTRSDSPGSTEPEPYAEPNPEENDYPDEWTPKQRENWDSHGQSTYENLETDAGRYWYRRIWRPKKQREGMMKRDHVKLGTPEDYVAEHARDTLDPMGNLTSVMMRRIGRMQADKDELEEAYKDIVQARIANMTPEQRARLAGEAKRLAVAYGLQGGDPDTDR